LTDGSCIAKVSKSTAEGILNHLRAAGLIVVKTGVGTSTFQGLRVAFLRDGRVVRTRDYGETYGCKKMEDWCAQGTEYAVRNHPVDAAGNLLWLGDHRSWPTGTAAAGKGSASGSAPA
jgi:hypothetical protein